MSMSNRSLDAIRQDARAATYANSTIEHDTVQAVEQEVERLVSLHEQSLVNIAEAMHNDSDRAMNAGDELRTELRDLQSAIERAGSGAGGNFAARYQRISNRLTVQVAQLRRVQREAEFSAALVSDPYGSLQNIRAKYPALVSGRRLS